MVAWVDRRLGDLRTFSPLLLPPTPTFYQDFFGTLKILKFQIPFPPSVGGFISKSTGKKCEDKKASRRSEEVKNQVDPLSKFNICWVKIQLFSQSWESFQTWMRTGCSWRRGRGRHWSASSGICCDCSRYPPEDLKLGTHIAIRWSIWADPQKTPFDPFWRYTFSQVLVLKLTLPFQGFDPAHHSPLSRLTCLTRR